MLIWEEMTSSMHLLILSTVTLVECLCGSHTADRLKGTDSDIGWLGFEPQVPPLFTCEGTLGKLL